MAREQGRSMPIGTHAKQDEVKDWETRRVLLGELSNKLLFISIGELFEIVQKRCVDSVYILCGDGNL